MRNLMICMVVSLLCAATANVSALVLVLEDFDGNSTGFAEGSSWSGYTIPGTLWDGEMEDGLGQFAQCTSSGRPARNLSDPIDLTGDGVYYMAGFAKTTGNDAYTVLKFGDSDSAIEITWRSNGQWAPYIGGYMDPQYKGPYSAETTYLGIVKVETSSTGDDIVSVAMIDLTNGNMPDTEPVWVDSEVVTLPALVDRIVMEGNDSINSSYDNIVVATKWSEIASLYPPRGQAHTPGPAGTINKNLVANELTWVSGDSPDDPNLMVDSFDLAYYSVPADGVTSDDPNFENPSVTTVTDVTSPYALTFDDYDSVYFWRIDSNVTWDSNDVTGIKNDTIIGSAWKFTTLPADVPPVVNAGNDILTAVELLPVDLSAIVDDHGEGDIISVEWSITGYPEEPFDNAVARILDRTGTSYTQAYDPNLLLDMISTDDRDNGDPMRVIISDLDAGTYSLKSYHHDPQNQRGTFDVYIDDDNGRTLYAENRISTGDLPEAEISTFEATFVANGMDDVVLIYEVIEGPVVDEQFLMMNGMDIVGAGGALNIDFGTAEGPVKKGYQVYTGTDEDAASFVPAVYSAFGGTDNITLDLEWGREGAGMKDAVLIEGGTMANPTATLDSDYTGVYTVQVTVADENSSVSDTVTVTIASNACNAAVESQDWDGFSSSDLNTDCLVNLEDFAILASDWLDDRTLNEQE